MIALTYIYGIGNHCAQQIMAEANVNTEKRVNELSDQEVLKIREVIDRGFQVEGDLRREISMNIKRLKDLRCYRGIAP